MYRQDGEKTSFEDYALGYLIDHPVVVVGGVAYRHAGTHYQVVEDLETDVRRWFKRNKVSQNNRLVGNVVPIIRAVATAGYRLGHWVDGRADRLVPFANGLLRLGTGDLVPHSPDWLGTWCLPCDHDPAAGCPAWEGFLAECLNGEADQVALLQEWFGYVLSGDTHRQRYMTHVGAAGSGKSTVAKVLSVLVGSGGSAFNIRQLANRFGPAGLMGKTLAVCGEVELQGCKERAAIMETLKTITGQDAVQIERKGDNTFYSLALPTRFHIVANSMPALRDPTLALTRRMLLLFSDKKAAAEDEGLLGRLMGEMAGVVQWALRGYARLQEKGWTTPARMRAEIDRIRRDASPAVAYLTDRCRVARPLDPGTVPGLEVVDEPVWTAKEVLWADAQRWAADAGAEVTQGWFFKDLRAVLPRLPDPATSRRRTPKGERFYTVEGVALKA